MVWEGLRHIFTSLFDLGLQEIVVVSLHLDHITCNVQFHPLVADPALIDLVLEVFIVIFQTNLLRLLLVICLCKHFLGLNILKECPQLILLIPGPHTLLYCVGVR